MIYKDFKGKKLSSLGMGTMRLPVFEDKTIDIEKTKEMVDYAIQNGVNYFDTAWGYHDGESETVMGEVLSAYDREGFYLATKFPGYDLANFGKTKEIFEKQLEKLKTDYVDFYLIHCVCEDNIQAYLDEKYDTFSYLLKQKENGRIKHLGFSVHATYDTTKRFLDKWGEQMEFGQIQLNYLDYNYQDAKAKLELFKEYNLPVWVMEPVRGGSLADIKEEYKEKLCTLRKDVSPAEWAFRFLQSFDEVTMILSGMSNFEQIKDNVRIFSTHAPTTQHETKALLDIAHDMVKELSTPCTACRYCTKYCPKNLEIPEILKNYRENEEIKDETKNPKNCIGCRSCEAVCPQKIKISQVMCDFSSRLKNE